MNRYLLGIGFGFCLSGVAHATTINTVKKLSGCYLVDYSYSETEVLDPAYKIDTRVYDTTGFTVKEWIGVVDESQDSVRLQHFMQADNFSGDTIFMMRHHAEVWSKNPGSRYKYLGNFDGQDRWEVEALAADTWVREITHLDDGLRYQCAGKWVDGHTVYPRFECTAFAPIPGRETRDMGRRDYNALDRWAQVTVYGDSWLERQTNVKTQFSAQNSNQLVREVGKIWQTRLPDEECAEVRAWADARQPFWNVLNRAWKAAYGQNRDFYEIKEVDGSTRGAKIEALLQQHYQTIGSDAVLQEQVYNQILEIIEAHRE